MAAGTSELTRPGETAARRRHAGRALLARVPAAAWVCALVAILNAVAWSLITPPFHVPDEQSHYAYAEYLAEEGQPPGPGPVDIHSPAHGAVLDDLRFEDVRFVPSNVVPWSAYDRARLERDMRLQREHAGGNGAAYTFGGEPPLYYALQGIPYRIASGGTVLDQLALMRLLSACFAGATVFFVFLFLRELMPGSPWSWTVGALGVAFHPLFGFISGGMNSDALFYAASAALFFLLARAFRRGLTARLAVLLGVAMAVGLLTKYNAIGLVPGAGLALVAIGLRQEGRWRLGALGLPALALAIAALPMLVHLLLNVAIWDRPAIGASDSQFSLDSDIHPTAGGLFAYWWQFYLMPLPGTANPVGDLPLWEAWITGFIGLYGWIDTHFSSAVYYAAAVPLAAIVALATATLVAERRTLARRRLELGLYAVMAVIFLLFVATASYIIYLRFDASIAQARYTLPLLALYAAILALATRGAGRRWAPVVGTAIVALAFAHDIFSQLLVIARYYA